MESNQHKLDASGLNCPLPILRTKKAINSLLSGEVLEVTATDPGSLKDLEYFCHQTGNLLLSSQTDNNTFTFQIQKR